MRILIAEDDLDLNEIIVKKLRAEGYAIDYCFDGQEALAFLGCTQYDAAILDIMMPKMDGLAVVRQLRDAGNMTPVIFLTAMPPMYIPLQICALTAKGILSPEGTGSYP